jgi:folate-binding Fe-S cluster repair protein YgfZ
MSITQPDPPSFYFDDYGVIAFRGADARSFLQGQLSQDVLTLEPGEVRLASLNNPGRPCHRFARGHPRRASAYARDHAATLCPAQ